MKSIAKEVFNKYSLDIFCTNKCQSKEAVYHKKNVKSANCNICLGALPIYSYLKIIVWKKSFYTKYNN